MELTHIALFAGIGGDTLAAQWAGFKTVLLVEIDPYCQKVLNKHWPDVLIIGDIRTFSAWELGVNDGICYNKICERINRYRQTLEISNELDKLRWLEGLLWSARIANGKCPFLQAWLREVGNFVLPSVPMSICEERGEQMQMVGIGCEAKETPTGRVVGDTKGNSDIRRQKLANGEGAYSQEISIRAKNVASPQKQRMNLEHTTSNPGQTTLNYDLNYLMELLYAKSVTKHCTRSERTIALVTGGVPCQPASVAGKRGGTEDDRWLWPEALRLLREINPAYAVFENPTGVLSLQQGIPFEHCLSEMESYGYEVQTYIIPACGVNAPHRRDRIFIVGYSKCNGYQNRHSETRGKVEGSQQGGLCESEGTGDVSNSGGIGWGGRNNEDEGRSIRSLQTQGPSAGDKQEDVADSEGIRPGESRDTRTRWTGFEDGSWWAVEPEFCRILNELSERLDTCGLSDTPCAIMVLALRQEVTDATSKNTGRGKVLPTLPETPSQTEIQRSAGRQRSLSSKEVLQSPVHGKAHDEGSGNHISSTQEGREVPEISLPDMWDGERLRRSSQQWRPNRQLAQQSTDTMQTLSHSFALGTREGHAEAFQLLLQGLWGACQEIGYVPETLSEIPKVWQSLTDQEKDWVVIRVSTGNPFHAEWPEVPRIATGVPSRVDRLKGLGSAIVPQQIYPILKGIADIEKTR